MKMTVVTLIACLGFAVAAHAVGDPDQQLDANELSVANMITGHQADINAALAKSGVDASSYHISGGVGFGGGNPFFETHGYRLNIQSCGATGACSDLGILTISESTRSNDSHTGVIASFQASFARN